MTVTATAAVITWGVASNLPYKRHGARNLRWENLTFKMDACSSPINTTPPKLLFLFAALLHYRSHVIAKVSVIFSLLSHFQDSLTRGFSSAVVLLPWEILSIVLYSVAALGVNGLRQSRFLPFLTYSFDCNCHSCSLLLQHCRHEIADILLSSFTLFVPPEQIKY